MSRQRKSTDGVLREEAVAYRASSAASPSPLRGEGRGEVAPLTCLDLFCGCGGFTLGMQRAGFHCLAAIDFNAEAVATLRANLVEHHHPGLIPVAHALERDLTAFPPEQLAALIGANRVDVIVGGPPCQGYSNVRRVDGSNHGARLKADPRRHLYREYLRYVDFFQPRVFVMENVLGMRTAAGGEYFTRVQAEARALGYRVHGQVEDAWELGVPQKRRRQLIIGVRKDLPGYFLPELKPAPRALPTRSSRREEAQNSASQLSTLNFQPINQSLLTSAATVLWDAIGDLPILRAGGGEDERDYDLARRNEHVGHVGSTAVRYLCDVLEIDRAAKLTNHVARPHSERDLRDFALLKEGENSATAMRDRGVEFEFPYDKSSFKDRYTRQSRWKPCSTIVAHLSKDGLMFIHPTQNRSLTPREAARIQSFPDWFRFPAARTHAFRLIGNAVPPLIGEAVGLGVKEFLGLGGTGDSPVASGNLPDASGAQDAKVRTSTRHRASLPPELPGRLPGRTGRWPVPPRTRTAAAHALERLAQLDRRALRALPTVAFLRGWHALLFLFPGLHPDNALDHGDATEEVPTEQLGLPGFERELDRRHTRSGWPVALELIGIEAWRRYEARNIAEEDFYCVTAQRAGLNSPLFSEVKP